MYAQHEIFSAQVNFETVIDTFSQIFVHRKELDFRLQ